MNPLRIQIVEEEFLLEENIKLQKALMMQKRVKQLLTGPETTIMDFNFFGTQKLFLKILR